MELLYTDEIKGLRGGIKVLPSFILILKSKISSKGKTAGKVPNGCFKRAITVHWSKG